MNATAYILLGILLIASGTGAAVLRNPVHSGLSAVVAFVTLGMLHMALGAQFIGFVQLLVYIGAVAILAVFAILLTRPEASHLPCLRPLRRAVAGAVTAGLVLAALLIAIFRSPSLNREPGPVAEAPVAEIGELLMTTHLLPLQTIGVLLTAALIGAVLFASTNHS